MINFVSSQSSRLAASNEVAFLLAKEMKPFREGKSVKVCAIKIAEALWRKTWQKNLKRFCPIRQWQGE